MDRRIDHEEISNYFPIHLFGNHNNQQVRLKVFYLIPNHNLLFKIKIFKINRNISNIAGDHIWMNILCHLF